MTKLWRMRNPLAPVAAGGLGSGLAGGLVAGLVLCPPVLAVVLGLGSSTLLVSLGAHQTELRVVAGLSFTLIAAWWVFRRRAQAGGHGRPVPLLLWAVGAFVAAYAIFAFVAIPLLHDISHGIFSGG